MQPGNMVKNVYTDRVGLLLRVSELYTGSDYYKILIADGTFAHWYRDEMEVISESR